MAKTDTPQSDGPDVVDRRKLLATAAAMTAVSTMPRMADAEALRDPIHSSALPQGVRTPRSARPQPVGSSKSAAEMKFAGRHNYRPCQFRRSCAA